MSILGAGGGISLPMGDDVQVVEAVLTITNIASERLRAVLAEEAGDDLVLIISTLSGGCSGHLYDMQVTERPDDSGFQHLDIEGIQVSVHNRDSARLNGIEIDYVDTLMGGGFKINNPNADRGCGCGKSFG
ncbi:MAG: iron-sulfur cluster assembly accessory protein [Candidatus Poseidoniales archaeon]|jgi:iron-sulfur cluster assembly protein|nr:iron-sulfur cluster assembly accessory protein [Candidatus Poseidoniales archaeon]